MKTTKFAKIIALVLTLALLVGSVMTLSVSAEEAAADTTGKILAQSVIYGEKTYIMFAVQAENASDVTVTYTWEGDETVYTASVYDGAEYEGAVIFVTDGVALYELGKKATATVTVGGEVVDTKTYSVAEFLYRQLYNKADSLSDDQKAFYESLLVCGANAQKYIAKETENLVTDLTYVYTDNAEVTVNGGKYALVQSGATVELAYTGSLPVLSWTVGETTVETDAKTYTATVSGDSVKVDVTAYNYDPSYMTFKGENAYYISDFNNASVLDGVTQEHINPWGGTSAVAGNTVAHGNFTNGHGTFTGITFQQPSGASTYGSFNYTFPSAFDLTQAETVVFRIAASGWSNGNFLSYVSVKSGSTYTNLVPYLKIYRGSAMTGTPDQLTGSVISGTVGNYLTAYLELDVAAFIEATGITSISGIVFGANNTGFSHAIDEIYYTVEDYNIQFNTANTSKGSHTLADTEDGNLEITGPAWASSASTYTLGTAIDPDKINTLTIRFKTNGVGASLAYLGEAGELYLNLNAPSCVIENVVDAEGYTILTIDVQALRAARIASGATDITTFAQIGFKKNNASTVLVVDYVLIDVNN